MKCSGAIGKARRDLGDRYAATSRVVTVGDNWIARRDGLKQRVSRAAESDLRGGSRDE